MHLSTLAGLVLMAGFNSDVGADANINENINPANKSSGIQVFEDFNQAGQPKHQGIEWHYRAQLAEVNEWSDIIPGDGYAYLHINAADNLPEPDITWPFQMLIINHLSPGQRITIRAKNMVLEGVASFIFTYSEQGQLLDEIDLEITGFDEVYGKQRQDKNLQSSSAIAADVTDVRMNVWNRAKLTSDVAQRAINQPIMNSKAQAISHRDGKFHEYQLDWYPEKIEYFIDGVRQGGFEGQIPSSPSELNIGLRHMAWTGTLPHKPQVLVIDWIKIMPL